MALCMSKEYYEKFIKKEPEQDFYDCWKRVAFEIKKNEIRLDEEFNDKGNLWDEWNNFNR